MKRVPTNIDPEALIEDVIDFIADDMEESTEDAGALDRVRTEVKNIVTLALKTKQLAFSFDDTMRKFREQKVRKPWFVRDEDFRFSVN